MLPSFGHSFHNLGDGRRPGTVQTENTVRHTKFGRTRGMIVDEGVRSTGVLLYVIVYGSKPPSEVGIVYKCGHI